MRSASTASWACGSRSPRWWYRGSTTPTRNWQRSPFFVHSVGEEVPWHVTGFYPAYQML